MKALRILAVVAISCGFAAGCASAPDGESVANATDDDDVICERVHVVGSNFPKKVCRTVAERKAIAQQTKQEITNRQRSDTVIGTGGPDVAGPGN